MSTDNKKTSAIMMLYDGVLKVGHVYLLAVEDSNNVSSEFENYKKYYGSNLKSKYVFCDDLKDCMNKISDKLKDYKDSASDLYQYTSTQLKELLENVTDSKHSTLGIEENNIYFLN